MTLAPPTIRVTGQHIIDGKVEDCQKCPIALALLEQANMPGARAEVSESELNLYAPDGTYSAVTPQAAREFILAFDECRGVRPFEFGVSWNFEPSDGGDS